MFSKLQKWNGTVEIDGTEFQNIQEAESTIQALNSDICILLHASKKTSQVSSPARPSTTVVSVHGSYKITVKPFMTRKATELFDFMAKWNNDNPMPLRTMTGIVEKETPGMVYMKLHGDILQEKTSHCMKCGKPINNPVSQFFGMGPECGGHNYVNPFETEAELKKAISAYRLKLQNIKWEGWIIKSAIIYKEEINNDNRAEA